MIEGTRRVKQKTGLGGEREITVVTIENGRTVRVCPDGGFCHVEDHRLLCERYEKMLSKKHFPDTGKREGGYKVTMAPELDEETKERLAEYSQGVELSGDRNRVEFYEKLESLPDGKNGAEEDN